MARVHLLTGDDELLLQRATQRLLDELRSDDLDVEVHDVAELDRLPEMRTASLFGGRLCVVLRGAGRLGGTLKDEVEDYLAEPDPDAVLVLVAQGLAKNTRVHRLAASHGDVVEVRRPADWDTDAWAGIVRDEFALLGHTADAAAVDAVLDHAGLEPGVIASRVAQVVGAFTGEGRIGVRDVEEVLEGHGRQSGFAVVDAVTARDAATALTLLRGALESGEAPLAIVGALTYRFRQLSQVRGGASSRDVRVSPGQFRRLQGVARDNFAVGELGWCMDRLAQLDVDLKGGSELPSGLVLELGIIDLATPRQVGAPFNPLAG